MAQDIQEGVKKRKRTKRVIRFSDQTRDRLIRLAKENRMSVDDYVNHMLGGTESPQVIAREVAETVARRFEAQQLQALQAQQDQLNRAIASQAQANKDNLVMLQQVLSTHTESFLQTLGKFFKGL